MNWSGIFNNVTRVCKKNGNLILTIASSALAVAAVSEGIRATSKAKDIIHEVKKERIKEGEDSKLTKSEIISHTWKCYIWCALLTGGSVGCNIANYNHNKSMVNAYAGAYVMASEALRRTNEQIENADISAKAKREIEHNIAHEQVKEDKKEIKTLLIKNDTKTVFRDAYSPKGCGDFESDMNALRIAVHKFNKWMTRNQVASLNDWYDCLGLGHSDLGDVLVWRYDEDGPMELSLIPDDIDVDEDDMVTIVVGLKNPDRCYGISMPHEYK